MNPHPDLTSEVIRGIGWLYLLLCAMNVFWTARALKLHRSVGEAGAWAVYSAMLAMIGFAHVTGGAEPTRFLIRMPLFLKTVIDAGAKPEIYFALSIALFAAVVFLREQLVKPTVAWLILNGMILFMTLSLSDYDFRQIVGKPDNVPIVSMLFIVAFFTWLYFKRAVDNDQRIAAGRPLFEQEDNDKVLVWPDLVYTEMICMVIVTAVLVVWGIVLQAPLEEPASSVRTPNPSKAPWYFLGLQEMLVYYDPWMAGVVLPSMILVGLMALPYIDFNKKGNGYYTFNERKFSILTFMFGFLPLWIGLIILGTFLRGPNWNFFGIYELWDVHKLVVLNNVNLSEYFWGWLGQPLPVAPAGSKAGWQMVMILYREWLGLVLVAGYLFVLPMVMAMTIFRKFFMRMGFMRYMVFSNLVLFMACLPIKMILRWTVNLKYIVAIPEWFFNI
jgi:hypothetical protein